MNGISVMPQKLGLNYEYDELASYLLVLEIILVYYTSLYITAISLEK